MLSEPDEGALEAAQTVAIEAAAETDAHMGVLKVEASGKVYGKYSKWVLYARYGTVVAENFSWADTPIPPMLFGYPIYFVSVW